MIPLDPQRNLLSVLLIAAIGAAVLVGLAGFLLLGRVDVDSIPPAGDGRGIDAEVRSPALDIGELSEFAVITDRPVFFEDRQLPVIETGDEDDEVEVVEVEPEEEAPELNATVAGIIITPDMKLAMVSDNNSNETLVLREGMTMEGDKSAWRLEEIRARGVRFATDAGGLEELELEVETNALAAGAPPRRRQQQDRQPQAEGNGESEPDDDAQAAARARAEEIRRRVAERRAQLRAEAERRAREQQDGGR